MDVEMPQMGESLTEGTVLEWLKQAGDEVERDEPIAEIDTDKTATTLEAPVAGVLEEILVDAGETVAVGVPLARIAPAEGEQPAEVSADEEPEPQGHFGAGTRSETVSFGRQRRRDATAAGPADAAEGRSETLTPAVLRLAAEHQVPLETVQSLEGTGRGGRITKRDLERWLDGGGAPAATAPSTVAQPPPAPARAAQEPPSDYVYEPGARDQRTPMSSTRRKIAEHMHWSVRIAAHATAIDEVDMTALLDYVGSHRDAFQEEHEAPLNATVATAFTTVAVLREFPRLNAVVAGDEIIERPYIHLGVAVAVAETDDLLVPVITDADQLDLPVFARRLQDLVTRSRERRVDLSELRGGTFTYSNPGVAGGTAGTPIINQPQSAILGTYAIRQRPWVVDGEIVPRPIMGVSVSFDHRLVDGLMGFQFLTRLREQLESAGALTS